MGEEKGEGKTTGRRSGLVNGRGTQESEQGHRFEQSIPAVDLTSAHFIKEKWFQRGSNRGVNLKSLGGINLRSLVEEAHFKKEKWFQPGDNATASNGRVKRGGEERGEERKRKR